MIDTIETDLIARILAAEAELREAEEAERSAHDRQAKAKRLWRDAVVETAKRRHLRDRLIRESLPDPDRHPLFDRKPGEDREVWAVVHPQSGLLLYGLVDCDWEAATRYRDEYDPGAILEVRHGQLPAGVDVRAIADRSDEPPAQPLPDYLPTSDCDGDSVLLEALNFACEAKERWSSAFRSGISAPDLKRTLAFEWAKNPSRIRQFDRDFSWKTDGKKPAIWIGEAAHVSGSPPTLSGKPLLTEVRRVLGLGPPKVATPTPADGGSP